MNDKDMFEFLKGFALKNSKEEVTKLYIEGKITKEEYIKRMRSAK